MIVICTRCQAKFRVADEKIGPRGAKVRCSKCQTVFVVHPDLGTMSLAAPGRKASRPSEIAAPPEPAPAAPTPATSGFPPLLDDPFAVVPARAAFAQAAPAQGDDPFAPPPPAPAAEVRATLPVTDLSDLLRPLPAVAAQRPAAVAAEPARVAPPPLPVPPPLPAAVDDGMFRLDGPDLAPPPDGDDGGLALEDRLTPPPARVVAAPYDAAEPLPDFAFGSVGPAFELPDAGRDPFTAPGYDPSSFELAGPSADPAVPTADEPAAAPAASHAAHARPVAEPRAAAAPVEQAAPVLPQEERIPGRRGSRLRVVAVNAVSLLVMIAIAIAFLLVWRTDRPLEAGSFRPAAVLDAVRREPGTAAPFEALDVRSGVYERARAAPLLFVRGQVLSRATRAVSAVTVAVEVVRAGQVLARGEAVAGAVPTAEELHEAADPAALARAARNAAARAPRTVRPGEAVPFLVAIGDAPADLEGASLRVAISPLGRATP